VTTVRRGEVWLADLDPTRGREQRGQRPVLIVSTDIFNRSGSGLVIAVPFTTRRRGVINHVEVRPPEGGLQNVSYVMCEQIRSMSVNRLHGQPFGEVSDGLLDEVNRQFRYSLGMRKR
jgi:mRNA interferase MazF